MTTMEWVEKQVEIEEQRALYASHTHEIYTIYGTEIRRKMRLTIKNHKAHPEQKSTYRILIDRVKNMEKRRTDTFDEILGDIADRLGRYEDLGEPEEIAKKLGIRWEP